jgi:predicted ATPase
MDRVDQTFPPGHHARYPLVGRERELALLRETFDGALEGHGGLVLVGGEAGIGKTTLVQAFIAEAAEQGALVLTGGCYDLTVTPPYGPWLDIADRYPDDPSLPELPEVLKRGTGVGELTSQLALFEVARDFLTEVATVQPLVLVLEDLHWADPASLDLLRFLARQLDGHRLLIVVTYRDDEVGVDHHLYRLLPPLVRESNPMRLDLRRLERPDIATLVARQYRL